MRCLAAAVVTPPLVGNKYGGFQHCPTFHRQSRTAAMLQALYRRLRESTLVQIVFDQMRQNDVTFQAVTFAKQVSTYRPSGIEADNSLEVPTYV